MVETVRNEVWLLWPRAVCDEQEQTEAQHNERAEAGGGDGTGAILPELLPPHVGKPEETVGGDRRPHADNGDQDPRDVHRIPVGRSLVPP